MMWSMMYDGSGEYGGSEEYDVVVVCTKITIVKEKHYLKIISPRNHMKPTIQEVGTNYTSTYRNI